MDRRQHGWTRELRRASRRGKALSSQNVGDLLQLVIELRLGLFPRLQRTDHDADRTHHADGDPHPEGQTSVQRPHAGCPIRQPTPRTFSMIVAPSFLRRPWITNSIALLWTLSSQPYNRSSI